MKKRRLKRSGAKYATSDSEDTDDEEGEEEGHYQVVEISPRHSYNTRKSLMRRLTMPRMTSLI